ncbi:MAG: bifunctional phosphopantothenoylcysteine decarboxylase/phosphopantothenate--cysteine ligase CoaBC [Candidatus Poribacteria bacterium]|nr:bifunctional phosphopantothenoylcysteine decarboxylase/phosphopantothenate--cysteine ligase CoaBC [Candidatus Poribacteria bacterium]
MELQNQEIILGVTGGIAIHKSLDLASQLVKRGASVHVVMTEHATRLVQPMQFQVISRNPVLLDLFNSGSDWKPVHIDLADRANLLAIVPATANIVGKMANGIADDALSTVAVSVHCPILIAPAMNGYMYQNPFVQANLQKLREHDIEIVEPASGALACGYEGVGRLNEVDVILERMTQILTTPKDLQGKRVVVTAGPTREYLDPVRFISNRSSGKMGYAVAEAAHRRGATVILISGPATAEPPTGVELRNVETALEMQEAILDVFDQTDIVVMAAAVADYRPQAFSHQKIKKTTDQLTIPLEKNPDIAQSLGQRKAHQITVGFAAETSDLLENAQRKLVAKNLDLIAANDVLAEGAGFEGDTNIVTLIDHAGNCQQLPLLSKRDVAHRILDRVVAMMQSGN